MSNGVLTVALVKAPASFPEMVNLANPNWSLSQAKTLILSESVLSSSVMEKHKPFMSDQSPIALYKVVRTTLLMALELLVRNSEDKPSQLNTSFTMWITTMLRFALKPTFKFIK